MLKTLVKKQLMEIFRSWFYNSKKNKKRSQQINMILTEYYKTQTTTKHESE